MLVKILRKRYNNYRSKRLPAAFHESVLLLHGSFQMCECVFQKKGALSPRFQNKQISYYHGNAFTSTGIQ